METEAYLRLAVGTHVFALPLAAVHEVLPLPRLARPPQLPPALAGFLDLGGGLLAVLRLDRLLDLDAPEPGLYAHLLRLRGDSPALALQVDRVAAVVPRAASSDWRDIAPDETFRGCVVGELVAGGEPAHVLSVERLLSEHERQRTAVYLEAERQRALAFGEEA